MQRLVEGCSIEAIKEEPNTGKEPLKKGTSETGKKFSPNGCFDCNICLDFAADPVVTLCGHLYCWPCIYKWFKQSASTSSQQCPVCKAALSQETLVPLYGHGDGNNSNESYEDMDIPHRPSFCAGPITNQSIQSLNPQRHHNDQQDYPYVNANSGYVLPYAPLETIGVFHSTAGGFLAGMAMDFLPLIFRNQQFFDMYHSGPYYAAGNGNSPRLRRQELEHQRLLNQIWIFLCCCAFLFFLLF